MIANITTTPQPVGILAARLNRTDRVEIGDGSPVRTVEEVALSGGRLLIEWADGSKSRLSPSQTVTAWI